MKKNEINLREQIATEIAIEGQHLRPDDNITFALNRAIGVIRKNIWHGSICPCSMCQKFDIRSCSDTCSKLTNEFPEGELERLLNAMAHRVNTLYYCGHCNNGRNEWSIDKMLFDLENEMAVTPCCHTEATEALVCYCVDGTCPADGDA